MSSPEQEMQENLRKLRQEQLGSQKLLPTRLQQFKKWAEAVKESHKEDSDNRIRDAIIRGSIIFATGLVMPKHPYAAIGMLASGVASKIPDLETPNPFLNPPKGEGIFARYLESMYAEGAIEFEAAKNIVNGVKNIIAAPVNLYSYAVDFLSTKTENLADNAGVTDKNIKKIADLAHHFIVKTPVEYIQKQYKEWVNSFEKTAPTRLLKKEMETKSKSEKIQPERKKVLEAKKQALDIVSKLNKKDEIGTLDFSKQLQSFAENLGYSGLVVNEVSQIAVSLGGHQRTWDDIGARGMGVYKIACGYAIGGILGAAMMVNGFIQMISGFQENAAFKAIYFELAEIKNILIQGFNQLSKQMSENFNLVLSRLHKMSLELDRLEPIISLSFKEIHLKELVDIIDEIKKDLDGEFSLSDDEKRKCLRRLSTWIDRHSKSKIQTSLLRDSKNISKCLELLEDDNFDLSAQFPFFMLQLAKVLPNGLLKNIDLNDLPNLTVLADACEVFVLFMNHCQFQDNYIPTLERASNSFKLMKDIIKQIKEESEIWDILFRQYNDLRYKVGRAIFKCRNDISNKELSLAEQLKPSANTEQLINVLDQMEMRRILLQRLAELTVCDKETYERIEQLDKKTDILKQKGEFYKNQMSKFLTYAVNEQYSEFRKSIGNGADINAWDSFGQAIHYISRERGKNYSGAIKLLHELLKSNEELSACYSSSEHGRFESGKYGTRTAYYTWGSYVLPIRWMMNNGHFDLGLLYCASGFDIRMDTGHFLNGLTWATKSNWRYYVQYYLVSEMNNPKGFLNKKDLRKAYAYYKAIESGMSVSSENINHDCLLWLTCVLGDLKPLISLGQLKADVNLTIPNTGFSPLMMAGNCNNKDVFEFLIKNNANTHIFLGSREVKFSFEKDNPIMHILISVQNFALAKEARKHGIVITKEQQEKINEGLRSLVPVNNTATTTHTEAVETTQRNSGKTPSLIKKQMEDLQKAIQFLKIKNKAESEIDPKLNKEASLSKEKSDRPVVFSTSSQKENTNVTNDKFKGDVSKIFEKCKLNFTLINSFISKLKQENELLETAKAEMLKLKDCISKINSAVSDNDLNNVRKAIPIFHQLVDLFDTVDGILKSDLSLQYPLGNNIDRMLSDLRDVLKKCSAEISTAGLSL